MPFSSLGFRLKSGMDSLKEYYYWWTKLMVLEKDPDPTSLSISVSSFFASVSVGAIRDWRIPFKPLVLNVRVIGITVFSRSDFADSRSDSSHIEARRYIFSSPMTSSREYPLSKPGSWLQGSVQTFVGFIRTRAFAACETLRTERSANVPDTWIRNVVEGAKRPRQRFAWAANELAAKCHCLFPAVRLKVALCSLFCSIITKSYGLNLLIFRSFKTL